MIDPILTTILATTILINGIHARATMEPPMVKTASNELNVDGPFAKTIDLSALEKYLAKVIHELDDMDNWVKDESSDIMTMPVSIFLKVDHT